MKTTILKMFILFIIMVTTSCSSDDDADPKFLEENFLTGYLEATSYNQKETSFTSIDNYELGLDFTPLVTGRITALKVMLPVANPSLRITVWDKVTNTIFKTEFVNVATADTEFSFDITDIELTKDKAYAITMNSKVWYERQKTDGSEATYPVTVGNIQINRYKLIAGSSQTYPTYFSTSYYYGDLSFDFIQTE